MILNIAFFVVCMGACFVCACRLQKMDTNTKPAILARYVAWGTALGTTALFGLLGWFTVASYALLGAFVVDLTLGFPNWQRGQPDHAIK